MPTVVVIDDRRLVLMHLCALIEEAFPAWIVLPKKARRERKLPFKGWDDVVAFLLTIEDEDVVLCADLALSNGSEYAEVAKGVHQLSEFKVSRPRWTYLACTMHSSFARHRPEFEGTFDGVLDKAELESKPNHKLAVNFIQSVIENVRRRRRLPGTQIIPAGVSIVDSLGIRLFRAAFSDEVLGEIVRQVAEGWRSVSVEALTSGYSGAYMLKLSSGLQGSSVILKVAKSASMIESELHTIDDNLSSLAPFGSHFVQIEKQLRQLANGQGCYYRQVPVRGTTLLRCCQAHSDEGMIAVEKIAQLCVRVLSDVAVADRPIIIAHERFLLTQVDVGRIETSAKFLSEVGEILEGNGLWPKDVPDGKSIGEELTEIGQSWGHGNLTDVGLREAVQHGDLNPGNVMIDESASPVLIDFQRVGMWPLGYDLGRLSRLLRMRLVGALNGSDWFPFDFLKWCDEYKGTTEDPAGGESVCPEASRCESAFFTYVHTLNLRDQEIVKYGYYLGALWDLLKITSYQDLSPFKRAWAQVQSWRIAQRLMKSSLLVR